MKTTLEIPDQLYRHAKAAAALRGETLTALISEALDHIVTRSAKHSSKTSSPAREHATKRDLRMKRWHDEEAAFLKEMRGRNRRRRTSGEIISEMRRG